VNRKKKEIDFQRFSVIERENYRHKLNLEASKLNLKPESLFRHPDDNPKQAQPQPKNLNPMT
jgi:hypothetical protein